MWNVLETSSCYFVHYGLHKRVVPAPGSLLNFMKQLGKLVTLLSNHKACIVLSPEDFPVAENSPFLAYSFQKHLQLCDWVLEIEKITY